MDLFVNRPLRKLQLDRRFQPSVDSIVVNRGETVYLRVGFLQDNATTLDDLEHRARHHERPPDV